MTGGSYGLGVVWATALAESGADVALTARSADLLENVAAELASGTGREVSTHPGDVTIEGDVQRVVADTIARHGQIDILVNNAGINESTGRSSEETSNEHFRHAIDVDLIGVWSYAREVGRHMLERGSGSIVNIASICGMGATEFANPALSRVEGRRDRAHPAARGGVGRPRCAGQLDQPGLLHERDGPRGARAHRHEGVGREPHADAPHGRAP